MANTLTDLIPTLYAARNVVSRELTGLIPSVTIDAEVARAAVGQTVRSFQAPSATAFDITPSITNPDNGDQVITNVPMTIQKSRYVPVRWDGEESLSVSAGPGQNNIVVQQFTQAMRTLVNEIETDIAALHTKFSRAVGTAGTTPFATAGNFTDAALAQKTLEDNGAPTSDNQLVIDTTAGANLIGLQSRADYQGTDAFLRQGIILPLAGIDIRKSAAIKTAGANVITGTVTVTGANSAGATTIGLTTALGAAVAASAGDIVTFAGDGNQYVIAADATIGAATTGNIVLAAPGLRQATAGTEAVSGVAAAVRNMAFNRSSILLSTRRPAMPDGGDSADDVISITDDQSGLTFEVVLYRERRRIRYEVGIAWGVNLANQPHTALLLG